MSILQQVIDELETEIVNTDICKTLVIVRGKHLEAILTELPTPLKNSGSEMGSDR